MTGTVQSFDPGEMAFSRSQFCLEAEKGESSLRRRCLSIQEGGFSPT